MKEFIKRLREEKIRQDFQNCINKITGKYGLILKIKLWTLNKLNRV